jgi:erythronate-4-phosphate dehydrogenase
MQIIVDAHIPFVVEAIQHEWPATEVLALEPDEINADSVKNADVLIIRTRTRVNEALLAGSRVRLVCTATIGYDHIDTAYCEAKGIRWISCPGCNAQAVCDYIEEAIEEINNSKIKIKKSSFVLGVIGVGHVGSLVAQMAEQKGLKVLLNDPPKGIGVPLDEIARNCDIITFHVPLAKDTYHLCDEAFLNKCKPGALIINAARGGVVDEQALLSSGHPFILDTWENEPDINPTVLSRAFRASMHIAGYSISGKKNASQMCLNAISDQFHLLPIDLSRYDYPIPPGDSSPGWLSRITSSLQSAPSSFEHLRKIYPLR